MSGKLLRDQSLAGPPLLCVTMSPEAAEHLKLALNWAAAVASVQAEELREGDRQAMFAEHASWLQWAVGRIINAEIDDA